MHGCCVVLDNGRGFSLAAGYANRYEVLEVKARIILTEEPKPIIAPICLFLTQLKPEGHCSSELMTSAPSHPADCWEGPIEVGSDCKLTKMA